MSAFDGGMTANDSPHQCDNGCGPMWRVTEREDRQKAQRSFVEQFDKLQAAERRCAELEKLLDEVRLRFVDEKTAHKLARDHGGLLT
jgi:hypothetical protein